jgi:hypothetical protein
MTAMNGLRIIFDKHLFLNDFDNMVIVDNYHNGRAAPASTANAAGHRTRRSQ